MNKNWELLSSLQRVLGLTNPIIFSISFFSIHHFLPHIISFISFFFHHHHLLPSSSSPFSSSSKSHHPKPFWLAFPLQPQVIWTPSQTLILFEPFFPRLPHFPLIFSTPSEPSPWIPSHIQTTYHQASTAPSTSLFIIINLTQAFHLIQYMAELVPFYIQSH